MSVRTRTSSPYRSVNLMRVFLLGLSIYVSHAYHLPVLVIANYIFLALALIWIAVTEIWMRPSQEAGRLSYIPPLLDLTVISIFVYYTGTINSFAAAGYLYITGTCAMNTKVRQDLFALWASSIIYPLLPLLVLFGIVPAVHVLGGASSVSIEHIALASACFLSVNIGLHLIIRKLMQRLHKANARLMSLAMTDRLTGLSNRRHFERTLDLEWRRLGRRQQSLAMILLDVDHFKQYNDHLGHQGGDECLRRVSAAINASFGRAEDCTARIGGEEFAILLVECDESGALSAIERLRCAIVELAMDHPTSAHGVVTVSAGVAACVPGPSFSPQTLFRAADEALYAAKHGGRNCTRVAPTFAVAAAAAG